MWLKYSEIYLLFVCTAGQPLAVINMAVLWVRAMVSEVLRPTKQKNNTLLVNNVKNTMWFFKIPAIQLGLSTSMYWVHTCTYIHIFVHNSSSLWIRLNLSCYTDSLCCTLGPFITSSLQSPMCSTKYWIVSMTYCYLPRYTGMYMYPVYPPNLIFIQSHTMLWFETVYETQ